MNVSFSVNIAFPNGSPEITTTTTSRQKLEFSDVLTFETIEEIPEEPQNASEEPKADLIIFDPSPVASDCSESDFAESSFLSNSAAKFKAHTQSEGGEILDERPRTIQSENGTAQKIQLSSGKLLRTAKEEAELSDQRFQFPWLEISPEFLAKLDHYTFKKYNEILPRCAYYMLLYNFKKFVFYERFNGYFLPFPAVVNNSKFQKEKLYSYLQKAGIITFRTGPYRNYYSKSILLTCSKYAEIKAIYDEIDKIEL